MANMLPRQQRLAQYWFHSVVSVYFALLLLIRIAWRLSELTPRQPSESAGWEKAVAHLGHLALYGLTIAVPVTGHLSWSAFPAPFDPARAALMDLWVLGIYKLPAIHDKADRTVFQFWEHSHMYLSWALGALVIVRTC
jgi:cytochrome b561